MATQSISIQEPTTPEAQEYEFHEAANLFPLLGEKELNDLAKDIKEKGLNHPIILAEGKILDGRNRYLACLQAGIEPRFEEWKGGNPWEWVWSENAERRHLAPGTKATLFFKKQQKSEAWQEAQRKRKEDANKKRAEAAEQGRVGRAFSKSQKESPEFSPVSNDTGLNDDSISGNAADSVVQKETIDDVFSQASFDSEPGEESKKKTDNRTRKEVAKETGVSDATAARAQALFNARPDLADRVASGEISLNEACRQRKKEELKDKAKTLPSDKYRVIYADPPWEYGNAGLQQYGHASHHYPTMSINQLCELPVHEITEENAVLFLWVTSPLLEDSFKVIKAWGFKYKTSFVWDKVKHNFGHYNSVRHEFLLVCTKGSCTPDAKELHDSVIEIDRSEKHSQKPSYFRELIERLYTAGKKIELFCREPADGWNAWGNELQQKEEVA